jgi:hypothetical protein
MLCRSRGVQVTAVFGAEQPDNVATLSIVGSKPIHFAGPLPNRTFVTLDGLRGVACRSYRMSRAIECSVRISKQHAM